MCQSDEWHQASGVVRLVRPPRGRPGWTCQQSGIFCATGTSHSLFTRMGPAHANPTTCLQHFLMQGTSQDKLRSLTLHFGMSSTQRKPTMVKGGFLEG